MLKAEIPGVIIKSEPASCVWSVPEYAAVPTPRVSRCLWSSVPGNFNDAGDRCWMVPIQCAWIVLVLLVGADTDSVVVRAAKKVRPLT